MRSRVAWPRWLSCRYRAMSSRERTAWVISSTIEYADYTASSKFELQPSHFKLRLRRKSATDRISEISRGRRAAQVARADAVIGKHGAERLHDPVGQRRFADVAQHQQCREQQRHRIGDVASRDIGCAAMHGFENADVGAEVGCWHHAETADQSCTEI